MNKAETIKAICAITGDTQKKMKEVMEAVQDVVFTAMKDGEEVALFDGVKFYGKVRPAATRRNPQTGEAIECPEKTVPAVKFGKAAKEAVL